MHHRYVILNICIPKGRTLSVPLFFFLFCEVGEEIFVCVGRTQNERREESLDVGLGRKRTAKLMGIMVCFIRAFQRLEKHVSFPM